MNKTTRRRAVTIKTALRDVRSQLALLNRQVGTHLELREIDLDCLDVITRHGPITPSALAARTRLHPATVTGILDRLQRGHWVVRERDPDGTDRRAVDVRALPDRSRELFGQYAGMSDAMDRVCAEFSRDELEVIARFLRRTADAGVEANRELLGDVDR